MTSQQETYVCHLNSQQLKSSSKPPLPASLRLRYNRYVGNKWVFQVTKSANVHWTDQAVGKIDAQERNDEKKWNPVASLSGLQASPSLNEGFILLPDTFFSCFSSLKSSFVICLLHFILYYTEDSVTQDEQLNKDYMERELSNTLIDTCDGIEPSHGQKKEFWREDI